MGCRFIANRRSSPAKASRSSAPPHAADPGSAYPRYLAGEQAAPPEDCGGIPGFYTQLEILADPEHPEHHDVKDWFGDFDPNSFDEHHAKARIAPIANRRRTTPTKTKPR